MPRTLALRCTDWPVVARRRADPSLVDAPLVVLEVTRRGQAVRAASAEARARGVVRGMRRREAEACCPGLVVVDADDAGEAVAFEGVARALEAITPRLEVQRPGRLAFPTLGPSRCFGGDAALGERVLEVVAAIGVADAGVGVAEGRFAAARAAWRAGPGGVRIVAPGESRRFLAGMPVEALEDPELAPLLRSLGLVTLGDFAALPEGSVLARFGRGGVLAHRRARAGDEGPGPLTTPAPELARTLELDPPAEGIDAVAFAAKAAADELLDDLAHRGLACARMLIEAETEHGETLRRRWHHAGGLTPLALAARVRWQLEAWHAAGGTTAGLVRLRLVPDEVVPAVGRQLGFWGGDVAADERAARALVRVQATVGIDAVVRPVRSGGRTPDERVRWHAWGEPDEPVPSEAPWPGQVPGPAPGRVFVPSVPAELLDGDGCPVVVSGRGVASAPPAEVRSHVITGVVNAWAGPWPQDLRWWDRTARRRRVVWQLVVAGATACLVEVTGSAAGVAAIYD